MWSRVVNDLFGHVIISMIHAVYVQKNFAHHIEFN